MKLGDLVEPVYAGKWGIPHPLCFIFRYRITAQAFHPPTQSWCWVLTEDVASRTQLRYADNKQQVLPDETALPPRVLLWPCDEVNTLRVVPE